MLRNRALAVLQKTYDDSYLSCSTAIYYEGQVSVGYFTSLYYLLITDLGLG